MRLIRYSGGRRQSTGWRLILGGVMLGAQAVSGIDVNFDDNDSIKAAAKVAADGMMSYYTGNQTGQVPGLLPGPYYWWEAGAMFGTMVDYWFYTGHTEYNDVVKEALLFQVGANSDFMPSNQTKDEGNDDQAFWAFAAMSAAENKFPDPPSSQPQWLALAQAVFNLQTSRWDTSSCNGGLRWQIYPFNNGYNYKNSISNGCFFSLAARLARYTGNTTYADWAEKMWDWTAGSPLMSSDYQIYDGTDILKNCSDADKIRWTYNAGVYLHGASVMYNYTNADPTWKTRVDGLLNSTNIFFQNNIMTESACEPRGNCNVDQRSFKAYLSRWLAATTQMAPYTTSRIMTLLRASGIAAAKQCTGGASGTACGIKWTTGTWDGSTGVGEQMSALSVIQANLIGTVAPPVTADSGGTSQGNPNAGAQGDVGIAVHTVTRGDRVGAAFITVVLLLILLGTAWWMVV